MTDTVAVAMVMAMVKIAARRAVGGVPFGHPSNKIFTKLNLKKHTHSSLNTKSPLYQE